MSGLATFLQDGCLTFSSTPDSLRWAKAARVRALQIASDPKKQAQNLRHGKTWFVGVDAMPNAPDGSVDGVPLAGPWTPFLPQDIEQHPAQVSIIYPGYPQQDTNQSDANHRYRVTRDAAHMDGLLPSGPDRRRLAEEFHAFILGIGLGSATAGATVYWRGSHHILRRAMKDAMSHAQRGADVTEAYHAARKEVFETCERVELPCTLGASFLLHRFTLHGTAPWGGAANFIEGRIMAFFRPEFPNIADWFTSP